MSSHEKNLPTAEGVRGTLLPFATDAETELDQAFLLYQRAFNRAVDEPCVRHWRAAVAAADHLVDVSRKC